MAKWLYAARVETVNRSGSCRSRGRVGFVALLSCVLLSVLGATPVARAAGPKHKAATALQNIQSAGRLVGKIPKSQFARGGRAALLNAAGRAVRLARTKKTCAALAAADGFLNALGTPTTWRKRRVPRGLLRKPSALLALSEHALMRRAGSKCARPVASHLLVGHKGGSGAPMVQPPNISPSQGEGVLKPIPLGKLIRPKTIGTGSGLGADPHGGGLNAARDPFAKIASDPLSFFRNSDVGIPVGGGSPEEPTAAIAPSQGVVWYTGNTADGLSTDNGRTFTQFYPSNVLPDQGLAFCCDQLVSYSPQ